MEKRLENMKKEYDKIIVPDEALNRIMSGIERANEEKKIVSFTPLKRAGLGIAAAVAICIISVNSSAQVARAMGDIPVVGGLFKVITFREYGFDDGKNSGQAQVPEIESEGSVAAGEVNAEVKEYIDEIMTVFEEDCKVEDLGYESLDVNYAVLTNNDKYFSLDIVGANTAASGYEFHKFYTIDKKADKVLRLRDLYADGYDYVSEISSEIIRQMEKSGEAYYIGEENEGFTEIIPEQSFYINEKGNIVICFNEYEVGPGSLGAPQFEIIR